MLQKKKKKTPSNLKTCYNSVKCYLKKKCFDCVVETATDENNSSSGGCIHWWQFNFTIHTTHPWYIILEFEHVANMYEHNVFVLDTSYIQNSISDLCWNAIRSEVFPIDLMDSFVRTTIDCCINYDHNTRTTIVLIV